MTHCHFRIGGACAVLSAVTTFFLWLLPSGTLPRLAVNFVHVFLALTAYAATAVALWPRRRAGALFGMLWFLLWGFTELLGVSIQIWTVQHWKAGLATAEGEARRSLEADIAAFAAVWDGMFLLLLCAFLLGTLAFGLAMVRTAGLERVVGALMLAAAPLTIVILLQEYAGWSSLGTLVGGVYPVLQPVSRSLLGVWLWRRNT
ncbi:MAG TPA: hypothetical protein VFQ07_10250 [Candidatus Polarisedimenticolia bacterium]|nr:hypothetical protein [Candidatus Polarisedimenticolia bacterium]